MALLRFPILAGIVVGILQVRADPDVIYHSFKAREDRQSQNVVEPVSYLGEGSSSRNDQAQNVNAWSFQSASCSMTTVTITIRASALVTTVTLGADNYVPSETTKYTNSTNSATQMNDVAVKTPPFSSLGSTGYPTMVSAPSNSTATNSNTTHSVHNTGLACPTVPIEAIAMPPYFGFNVVNTKPHREGEASFWKTSDDWDTDFGMLKTNFPNMNAVKMYSVTDQNASMADGLWHHLELALPAAKKHNLSILAGVWTDASPVATGSLPSFERWKKRSKRMAVTKSSLGQADQKGLVASILVDEINLVRRMLRGKGCCVPVTHTDTWNEFQDPSEPHVAELLKAVDQAIIVNIFPYWEGADLAHARDYLNQHSELIANVSGTFGKEVWLGETGWPTYDKMAHNDHGTSTGDAQRYFSEFGCMILQGKGTAFYYVDWDEDKHDSDEPAWGLFNHKGNSLLENLNCSHYKDDMRSKATYPRWYGGDA